MLRCESVIPRRGRLTRRLLTWSFAILVIGGAALDATVLSKEPTRRQANVSVQPVEAAATPAPTPVERDSVRPRACQTVGETGVVFFQPAEEGRANNRIDVDGMNYKLVIPGAAVRTAVELRARAGCVVNVGTRSARAPASAVFPEGTYEIWSGCDPAGTPVTRLTVVRDTSR